ncbi:type VI secretion system Vgr family protein [Paraburkholderia sp. J10-1]|uniref:type VI secretion system Vgr family protein n=1 Tax=Paraburkholderia sp. J10-1 TaxID=2805430 RepID=UPI002AB6EFD3|nr:type VI secretion system Vgr family protein [Paraburkholderia sp. J10-1]
MAESDNIGKLITGRQSACMEVVRRYRNYRAPEGERKPMPVVSVVEWEVREEVCQPYRIKALVSTSGPVSRKDMLGQWARFAVQPEPDSVLREFTGFIARFHSVSRSPDGCTYRIVIRQRLALLDGPSNCATYQNRSSADIIEEVIRRSDLHPRLQVERRLRREHPKHAFRFQYNMGDWSYCRLEMEQAGLFCFTENGKHGEVLVIADDIDGYTRPAIELKERHGGGLISFEESVYSLKVRTRAVPDSFIVADYNPEKAVALYREEGRARDEFSAEDDETMVGTPYVWGTHHEDAQGAKREALLRHEAARSQQVTCKAKSTMPAIRPGCIVKPDALEDYAKEAGSEIDAKEGVFVFKVVHRGARNQNYRNTFHAIPANRPYRLPIDESKWPRVHTLGFTVTSPDRYTYPYLDAEGRIIVRFHCDFGNWPKGGESVPLRMAKPFASKDRSGLNMPPVDGDHGIAGFYEGNPNKPFALAFLPNSVNPDHINSSRRRMSRGEIASRSGNKLRFDDWENQRGVELRTEEEGRSQLSMGYIPDRELAERGRGVELRTASHLVNRGGKGVMVTAYDQGGGQGKVLAMDETDAQLKDHQALSKSLADSAEASKATPADLTAQQGINDGLHALKKPGVLVTGPGPVGIASGDGVHVAADSSLIATTKKGMHFSTLKRFTVAAGGMLSHFSQKGMNLITAAGDFVAQAQRGRMQLASQGDMTVETVDGVVHVKSQKEIVLNAGGTYMKLSPGGIEFGSRGGAVFKTTGLKKIGPVQMDLGGAAFAPKLVPFTTGCEVWRTNPNFIKEITPAPAPAPVQWQGLVNTGAVPPAPSLDAGSMASAGGGALQDAQPLGQPLPGVTGSAGGPVGNGGLVINDPENEKDYCISPDPIQLQPAVPCNWQLSDFVATATMQRETPTYQKYGWGRSDRLVKDGRPEMCSGTAPTTCQFTYDSSTKTLTAKVVTALVPRLLVKMNPATREPLRDEHNNYVVVQYETFGNGANSGKSFAEQGLMLVERDPAEVDASTYKSMIEKTLNQGNYKLILDGCSKGAACGCRVAVKFSADVHVVRKADAPALNPNITINLYPTTERADAENWPESEYTWSAGRSRETVTQTKAHETGHLFNFPDEYWEQGGFVHSMYIKNGRDIDFALADANKTANKVWVIETKDNLMGGGCAKPTATTSPYYLEYIRRWFSAHTNKLWRVGYNAPAVSNKKAEGTDSGSTTKTGDAHAKKK